MRPQFEVGLVVGKFAPLHEGHVRLVDTARSQCKTVIVVSYSSPELPRCGPEVRDHWLRTCLPGVIPLVVTNERLASWMGGASSPLPIPLNVAPDSVHRDFVAMLCERVLQRHVDAVFTSESYGEGFAAHLTERFRKTGSATNAVAHISYDPARTSVPVSSTGLRDDPRRYWRFLPAPVSRSLARRVAVLGGESSGKSTFVAALAEECAAESVTEYGRELWDARSGKLQLQDMIDIAREQVRREDVAGERGPLVFCDTTPLTTLFYSRDMFGIATAELSELAARRYDQVVLCAPDFAFVQDGTRRDDAFRLRQDAWYRSHLESNDIDYRVARGEISTRVQELKAFLKHRWPEL